MKQKDGGGREVVETRDSMLLQSMKKREREREREREGERDRMFGGER